MNFSETLTFSGCAEFSPDSNYLALSRSANLNIYSSKSAELYTSWSIADVPSSISWSPNSEMVFTTHTKRNLILVFSVKSKECSARITASSYGITGVWWTPDSRYVCAVTDFQLRLSAWSLTDSTVYHIKNPKFEDRGYSFTSDHKFMLLAEKSDCKDYIGIYFLGDWSAVNHFLVDTFDLEDARWANDTAIVVIDTCLVYQLLIYSPMGNLLARHRPYDNGLGIKTLSISPNKTYLGVGSYDQSLRLFSKISWIFVTELKHENPTGCHFYREEEYKEGYTDDRLYGRFVVQDPPEKLPSVKVPKDKPNPATCISFCDWSCNSAYIASKNEMNPNCLWIWKVSSLSLFTLTLQTQPIKHLEWSPKSLHLAFCTGTGRLFFWSTEGASVCEVPLESKDFKVNKFKWSPDGSTLLIIDKNKCMLGFPKFDILDASSENYF